MQIDIYKDGISYVTNTPSTIPITHANLNEENRAIFVTELAAVSRGKSNANHPAARYQKLLKEAAPQKINKDTYSSEGSPSRPLEFLPIVFGYHFKQDTHNICLFNLKTNQQIITIYFTDFANYLAPFGYQANGKLYTNMRAAINAGIPYESIPYNEPEDLVDFIALKANIPMFVWAQVPNTHTQISKEAQSDRVIEVTNYWLPEDFRERLYTYNGSGSFKQITFSSATRKLLSFADKQAMIKSLVDDYSQTFVQLLFKELGYPLEIYSRAMYYFKYKEVVMTGWKTNPMVWDHLLIERSTKPEIWKNWTQDITKTFVEAIKQSIGD